MEDIEIKVNNSGMEKANKEINEFLIKIAEDIREHSKKLCPVKTGKLKQVYLTEILSGSIEEIQLLCY
jgi:hypothetical protein